jgi:hypothetical protein
VAPMSPHQHKQQDQQQGQQQQVQALSPIEAPQDAACAAAVRSMLRAAVFRLGQYSHGGQGLTPRTLAACLWGIARLAHTAGSPAAAPAAAEAGAAQPRPPPAAPAAAGGGAGTGRTPAAVLRARVKQLVAANAHLLPHARTRYLVSLLQSLALLRVTPPPVWWVVLYTSTGRALGQASGAQLGVMAVSCAALRASVQIEAEEVVGLRRRWATQMQQCWLARQQQQQQQQRRGVSVVGDAVGALECPSGPAHDHLVEAAIAALTAPVVTWQPKG